MATDTPESAKIEQASGEDTGGKRDVVSEEELNDLHWLAATRTTVRLIHSVDRCPECPSSFQEVWKEAGSSQPLVALTMATMAANMLAEIAGLHATSDKANEARTNTLLTHTGAMLIDGHPCTGGHTDCITPEDR
ncbi:hypothetical protein [Actinomadura sp. 7K507]|uniref:hypothetical protein n=1 Tax=Actinomadura sp. 7K507 TaxID=2530365 RepID=UPI00104CF9D7|nr:hypothetical protein [Actinomadura sp. 7K507]TDC96029.1 hypothetical protein E1285_06300 [Actinomadura sp. 7K507]